MLQPAQVFELALFCHTSNIQTVIAGLKLRLFDTVELEPVYGYTHKGYTYGLPTSIVEDIQISYYSGEPPPS